MAEGDHNDGGVSFEEASDPTDICEDRNGHSRVSDEERIKDLPLFREMALPNFMWEEIDGERFAHSIDCCYEEIVHWRRNLFKVPSGKAGKSFVQELTRLFRAYANGSALECIALKAAMVLPALTLQKPHPNSKAKDHTLHLDRRLKAWAKGDINALLLEGRTIQRQLTLRTQSNRTSESQLARTFAKLMMEGKVRAALRTITENGNGGVLPLSRDVQEALLKKHPPKQPPVSAAILEPDTPMKETHFILFEQIDGRMIRETALMTNGSAGPSGLDAAAWKRLCSSFHSSSADLCDALASIAKRICSSHVDPKGLTALVACRLIALDKCPGVRPIGVGETVRRIIGKALLTVLKDDIQAVAGPLQLCAGQEAGCEAAIHAMRQVFENPEAEAAILVDASNAFNSLNRQNALRNIQHLCPSLATVLINTYREDVRLYIDGETLFSQEGTTQGDPLAMAMYAIAITPLIHRLRHDQVKQVWFADDATAGARLYHLRAWWDHLVAIGPEYGYHPNASKTWLIVKENLHDAATTTFQGTDVNITVEGKRQLGAALGTRSFAEEYVRRKVASWVDEIERLSSIALTQPHAAYAAYTHGLMSKWTFLARTVADIGDLFKPLEDAIRHRFLPALTGQNAFNDAERELMALPVRMGGLGITNPTTQAAHQYSTSTMVTAPLTALILQQSPTCSADVKSLQQKAKTEARKTRRQLETHAAFELADK
ncbi:MAG: reverse transcriptase domain-containing protein, partial [Gammaproteobacteria bacterium]|nr:reverse transcriptase domain-containing protein [Gammaproteobacteria bacterium]